MITCPKCGETVKYSRSLKKHQETKTCQKKAQERMELTPAAQVALRVLEVPRGS